MYFSTFKLVHWSTSIVVVVFLLTMGVLFYAFTPIVLWIFLIPIIMMLPLTYWSISRYQVLLDEHGGRIPFPGIWGLLGDELEDDHHASRFPPKASPTEDLPLARNHELFWHCPRCGKDVTASESVCPNCAPAPSSSSDSPSR